MNQARIVKDTPEVYHGTKALSNSGIREMLRCPARFKAMLDRMGTDAGTQTEVMLCGSVFHAMTLEPDAVAARYRRQEHCGNTKAGKEEAFSAREAGITLVKPDMWERCTAMSQAMRAHPLFAAARRADDFMAEVSVYWQEGTVPCKARIDAVASIPGFGPCIIDLKSTRDASPAAIEKSLYNFGYHRQAAWYRRALNAVGIYAPVFVLIFVEKDAPHVITAANVAESAQGEALEDIKLAVNTYKGCSSSGIWPGYTHEIVTEIGLPSWAYRRTTE